MAWLPFKDNSACKSLDQLIKNILSLKKCVSGWFTNPACLSALPRVAYILKIRLLENAKTWCCEHLLE